MRTNLLQQSATKSLEKTNIHSIDLSDKKNEELYPLCFYDEDKSKNSYGMNNLYYLKNGKPFFGIMGEFHFSRYPHAYWEEEIAKMKACGINVISTYVFWVYHEESEGEFCWEEDLNLNKFVSICQKQGLSVVLRIGPFCNGECRNGGLPDWLYHKPYEVRSTDVGFLEKVKILYHQIFEQVKGLLFRDGGPIIGVQLDNEYGMVACEWAKWSYAPEHKIHTNKGNNGEEYIISLLEIAKQEGFYTPYYFCTAWGSPIPKDKVIPALGGYAFPSWLPPQSDVKLSQEYMPNDFRETPTKYCWNTIEFDPKHYPYTLCELGAGMQNTYHHRPIVPSKSVETMTVSKLASGVNFLGYYMFHGGIQPQGKYGYFNAPLFPKKSYDFQAPLGKYGQVNESYPVLKNIFSFATDFADEIVNAYTYIPDEVTNIKNTNDKALRWCVRDDEDKGFVFVSYYQDYVRMIKHKDVVFEIKLKGETIHFPQITKLDIEDGFCGIFPYNLSLEDVVLKYATVQPLKKFQNKYIFSAVSGANSELCFEKAQIKSIKVNNATLVEDEQYYYVVASNFDYASVEVNDMEIILLSDSLSKKLYEFTLHNKDYLCLTDAEFFVNDNHIIFNTFSERFAFSIFPDLSLDIKNGEALDSGFLGIFKQYSVDIKPVRLNSKKKYFKTDKAQVVLSKNSLTEQLNDIWLEIDYIGDVGTVFINNVLVDDDYANNSKWRIGLKRFFDRKKDLELNIHIHPMLKGSYIEKNSDQLHNFEFSGYQIATINKMNVVPQYKVVLMQKEQKI